jgi:hypothetical protein
LASTVCPNEERSSARFHPGRAHALLKPIHYFEPGIRVFRRGLIQAGLYSLLQFADGERIVVEIAFQQLQPGFEWMHVAVHQARHQEAPFQVHRHGGSADKRRQAPIVANVHDTPATNSERLGGWTPGIRRENDAIAVDAISRAIGRRLCGYNRHD